MNKLVNLNINHNGNLVISVYDRKELEEINQLPDSGEMKLLEALEYQEHHGEILYYPDASALGHLTNTPIILEDVVEWDNETGYPNNYKEAYWYPQYEVSDCFNELLERGEVVFIKA